MTGFASTLATIWRLAIPYFRSEDRWAGRILLAAVIAIELRSSPSRCCSTSGTRASTTRCRTATGTPSSASCCIFCVLAGVFIVLAVYQLYLNQWLQIRWRRWMTEHYLEHWLDGANHYRMQLLGDAADNPDQRIAEDIQTVHRAHADDRHRPAQLGRDARLVRRHPVGAVGGGAAARCSAADVEYPGLSGLGGADLCASSAPCSRI